MKSFASEASQWRRSASRTVRSSTSISHLDARLEPVIGLARGETRRHMPAACALLRGPAAVDREVGAGDLRRIIAAQEQRQGRNLLGGDELLGRLRFQQNVVD